MTDATFTRDPDSVKPFTVDFTAFLAGFSPAAQIAGHTIIEPDGITVVSSSNTTTSVTAVISGGTLGATYDVVYRITLNQGPPYVEDQTVRFVTRER